MCGQPTPAGRCQRLVAVPGGSCGVDHQTGTPSRRPPTGSAPAAEPGGDPFAVPSGPAAAPTAAVSVAGRSLHVQVTGPPVGSNGVPLPVTVAFAGWEVGDDAVCWSDRDPVRAAESLAATGRVAGLVRCDFHELGGDDYAVESYLDAVGERLIGRLLADISTEPVGLAPGGGVIVAVEGEPDIDDDEFGVGLASRPDLPAEVVERLALSPYVSADVQRAAAANPKCSPAVRAQVGLLAD